MCITLAVCIIYKLSEVVVVLLLNSHPSTLKAAWSGCRIKILVFLVEMKDFHIKFGELFFSETANSKSVVIIISKDKIQQLLNVH